VPSEDKYSRRRKDIYPGFREVVNVNKRTSSEVCDARDGWIIDKHRCSSRRTEAGSRTTLFSRCVLLNILGSLDRVRA